MCQSRPGPGERSETHPCLGVVHSLHPEEGIKQLSRESASKGLEGWSGSWLCGWGEDGWGGILGRGDSSFLPLCVSGLSLPMTHEGKDGLASGLPKVIKGMTKPKQAKGGLGLQPEGALQTP